MPRHYVGTCLFLGVEIGEAGGGDQLLLGDESTPSSSVACNLGRALPGCTPGEVPLFSFEAVSECLAFEVVGVDFLDGHYVIFEVGEKMPVGR